MHLLATVIVFGVIASALLAIAGVGFTLQFGITNVLNLSYGIVLTSAIYAAYVIPPAQRHLWLGLVVGGLWGALVTLLICRYILTPFIGRGTNLFGIVIVSLGLALVIQ